MQSETQSPQKGLFSKWKSGLQKTSKRIQSGLGALFQRQSMEPLELEHLEQILIEADMGVDLAMTITEDLPGKAKDLVHARDYLKQVLLAEFSNRERGIDFKSSVSGPRIFLFTGINGAGKTTTIAKLAAQAKEQGHSVLLAAADTFRAAAIDQLATWASRLQVPLIQHQMGADPAAVAHDACQSALSKNIDTVFIDTAGRLHNSRALMEEMQKIVRVIQKRTAPEALESLLVLDGNAGQNSFNQAKAFKDIIPVDGLVISKLDGTAKGGIVISIERDLDLPVKLVGLGEGLKDLVPFDPETFVDALLDIKDRATE